MYAKTSPLAGNSEAASPGPEERTDAGPGFPERLRQAMGGSSAYAFAKRCGFAESLLRKYLTGASHPGLDKLAAIAEAADVSLDWLVRGQTPGYLHHFAETGEELVSLPHWDQYIARWPEEAHGHPPIYLCFRRPFLQARCLDPAGLGLVTARGDAMEPTIRDGDLLVVDAAQQSSVNGVFVLRRGDAYQPRRLQWEIPEGVLVKTDNEAYEDHRLSGAQQEALGVVGRVVGVFAGLWLPAGPQG